MLARGELHTIGATTIDEYRKHIEKDAALERRFQPVMVGERQWRTRSRSCAVSAKRYEIPSQRHVSRTRRSSRPRVLSHRYISDRFLPDKAIDLIDEAASKAAHGNRFDARGARTRSAGR